MINVTPIAITATSQEYACSVVENLCQAYCLAQSIQPQSAVSYSIASQETISGTTFVTVQATGTVTYQPRNAKCCCKPQVKMFTESFDIIFKGNGTPALALTQGVTSRAPANVKCNGNVYGYSMVTDVTITATFPG